MKQILAIASGPLAFCLILWTGPYEGLNSQGMAVLATTSWVALWWILEAIPIAATSLLPIILFPLTNALSIGATTSAYGDPLVFLYLGGFMIALAIERWDLHKRIALSIINLVGTNARMIILGFMVSTAFLSMWISNTATAVMMLPIGLAIVREVEMGQGRRSTFGKALMLGIAYSASIGGMATLIGTPPNLVFLRAVESQGGVKISFFSWMVFALPITIGLLIFCWFYLTRLGFSISTQSSETAQQEVHRQLKQMGPINYEEGWVLAVFAFTGLCWILRSFVLEKIWVGINDTIIGISGAMLLFILPGRSGRILDWGQMAKLPWGIVLLFGGGLAIAEGFEESGLSLWLGGKLGGVGSVELLVLIFLVVALVNFLTEITSNVATISMILPVLAAMNTPEGGLPLHLMVGATLAASCAFMLPVATPPNAVVFGSGHLAMRDMVKTGLVVNITSILLISLYVRFFLP